MRINARDLNSVAVKVLHCGVPMKYVKSSVNWEGKFGSGKENETVLRSCECGATLTITLSVPS